MKSLIRLTEDELLALRESINRELLKRNPEGYGCPDCTEYGVCGIYWTHWHDRDTGMCQVQRASVRTE